MMYQYWYGGSHWTHYGTAHSTRTSSGLQLRLALFIRYNSYDNDYLREFSCYYGTYVCTYVLTLGCRKPADDD
eukprot:scaffold449758_cov17-Prasinocladus_malaysianus.AAC.1